MLKSFFTITFRGFLRNWNFTTINILGLSVGIASCIVIFLIVTHELEFDKFHSKADRIYRVVHTIVGNAEPSYSAVTPYPFIHAFRNDFPDIPLATQFHVNDKVQITYAGDKMDYEGLYFADSLFFKVFDFQVIEGDPVRDLGQPGKIFLTESFAKKLLKPGKGKTLLLNNKVEVEVVGVVKDPPPSTHIQFTMLGSMSDLKDMIQFPVTEWNMNMSGYSYIVLPKGMSPDQLNARFEAFVKKYYNPNRKEKEIYSLVPLSDIHFDEKFRGDDDKLSGVSKSSLMVLSLLGIFILSVACVNFINLSTALAVRKSREIGVRKTLGASRAQLSRQFILEAFFITVVSLTVAIAFVELATPVIGDFLGKDISFNLDSTLGLFLTALTVATTLLAGAYPAAILSGFNPVTVLKNNLVGVGTSGANARKYLVMFQFFITQVLIIATLVVSSQMEFFRSKPLGFNKDAIINIGLPKNDNERLLLFRSLIEGIPGVENLSYSLGSPTSNNNFSTSYHLSELGHDSRKPVEMKLVDSHYLDTYGLQLVAGRWFNSTEERTNMAAKAKEENIYNYVVNESLVKDLGFSDNEEIIGKKITSGLNNIDAEVIGVVRDFHTKSLKEAVAPAVMLQARFLYYDAGIKFNLNNLATVTREVEKAYNKAFPEFTFSYVFLDDTIESLYSQEQKSSALITLFAILAVFISCLGLLGLVSFMTHQKMKEVGIRKVFGASVESIVFLFSKGYLRIIIMSFVFAAPIAWYVMDLWLQEFAYRIDIDVTVFVVALASTAIIALLTVSIQSFRAAVANPVNSLRNE